MKTLLSLLLLAATFAVPNLQAQVYLAGGDPAADPVPAVLYQSPVVYQIPVVYQAPVVYQGPVLYQAPVYFDPAATACSATSSQIIYFGNGACSAYRNASQCRSPIIYFGRGESSLRGYQFNHWQ